MIIGAKIYLSFRSMMDQEICVNGIRGNNAQLLDGNEFTEIGLNMMITGSCMFLLGFVSLIWTELEMGGAMMITTSLRIAFFLWSVLTAARNVTKPEKIWLSSMTLGSQFTVEFERDNSCCGWNNVFDYCDRDKIYQIIMDIVSEKKPLVSDNMRTSFSGENYAYNYEDIVYSSELLGTDTARMLENENICDPNEFNEFCVCDKMMQNSMTLNIFNEPCRSDCDGNVLYAYESCPVLNDIHGKPICQLNGCGDILLSQWNNKLMLVRILYFSFIASMIVYSYFKYQLAFYFIDEVEKRWVKLRSISPGVYLLEENKAEIVADGIPEARRNSEKDSIKEKLAFHFNCELTKLKTKEKFEYCCENASDSESELETDL